MSFCSSESTPNDKEPTSTTQSLLLDGYARNTFSEPARSGQDTAQTAERTRASSNDRDGTRAPRGRPRGRGTAIRHSRQGAGSAGSQEDQGRAPLGSSPTRGYNANYLLNFRHEPLAHADRQGFARRQRANRPQPYSRELFLQANYRFAVGPGTDMGKLNADPDGMVDWDDVVQVDVLLEGSTEQTCPITLGPLVCPQMTACGHVFSFTALLQHAIVHGGPELRAAAPCPLCFNPFVARELRCVRIVPVCGVSAGRAAKFTLLCRPRDSILPQTPMAAAGEAGPLLERFAKLRGVALPTRVLLEAADELAVHAAEAAAEGGSGSSLEVSLCHHAISLLADRASSLAERTGTLDGHGSAARDARDSVAAVAASLPALCEAARADAAVRARAAEAELRRREAFPGLPPAAEGALASPSPPSGGGGDDAAAGSEASAGDSFSGHGAEAAEARGSEPPSGVSLAGAESPDAEAAADDPGLHYYFQSSDGQWAFLHPLNLRCLKAFYGAHRCFPPELEAPVLEVESLTQTPETRRRLRFLGHLPLSTPFQLVEVDLRCLLPRDALAPFHEELVQRSRRRKRRAQAEARRAWKERQMREAEARSRQGPSMEEWRMQPLPAAAASAEEAGDGLTGDLAELELDAAPGQEPEAGTSPSGVSFAAITRMGFAAARDSPALAQPQGAWAQTPGGSRWGAAGPSQAEAPSGRRRGGKRQVLLFSSGAQRRY